MVLIVPAGKVVRVVYQEVNPLLFVDRSLYRKALL